MDEQVRRALDQLRPPEAVKAQAWEGVSQRLGRRRRPALRWAAAAAALAVFLMTAGGWVYFTPTVYLSVEAGPAWELGVNRFGTVVAVEPSSQSACLWQPYRQALEKLLNGAEEASVTVTGKDASQCQAVLSQVEEDTAGENVACQSADWEERQAAQAAGLPLGKYRVYAEIAALDGAFAPEEAQSMTMRQLRDLLEELSGQGQAPAQEEGVESQPTEESASQGRGRAATARTERAGARERARAANREKGNRHKEREGPGAFPPFSQL